MTLDAFLDVAFPVVIFGSIVFGVICGTPRNPTREESARE